MPTDRAILWTPRKLASAETAIATSHEVFIAQAALRGIQDHIASAPGREVGGLLMGKPFRCPVSGRPYVMVDAILPSSRKLPEETNAQGSGLAALEEALGPVLERVEKGGGARPAGWYHNHVLLGIFLSDRDAQFHLRHFPERWQCALVTAADPERPQGGVFQRSERGGLRRGICVPFWELLDEDARLPDGRVRTRVDWKNYATGAQVVVVPDLSPGADRTGRREGGRPEGGSREGARRGPVPGAPAAERRGGGPPRRRPAAPPVRPTPRPSPPGSVEVPLILPPDRSEPRLLLFWRRWRRWILALLGAVVALGGLWLAVGRLADRRSAPVESQTEAAGRFAELANGFGEVVERYRETEVAFGEENGAGCEELSAAYRAVDEAFLALSEHYARTRDTLGRVSVARYETATREMEEVDRGFDDSGCPRPD